MKLSDFSFELPEKLIAKYPTQQRTASRLLHLNGKSGSVEHTMFADMLKFVEPGDLLVFNNTRVIPARLLGKKETGGQVEVLIERITSDHTALAHVRASKAPKPGSKLILEEKVNVTVTGRDDALFILQFDHDETVLSLLEAHGHMPLPPYIDRPDENSDKERYQTVYNEKPGAVAAPTAGLHFDDALLAKIKAKGIELAFITLHVGAGTFQPVKVEEIADHVMHAEYVEVPESVVKQIQQTKQASGKVVAVGTTSVRSIESAAKAARANNQIENGIAMAEFYGDTDIFITPGYQFEIIDALITNFHLSESTLLMLVSAFSGYEHIMAAYKAAVEQEYRFFSYGDAMYLTKSN